MSTKSTIILSKDNEHWYSDCAAPRGKVVDGKVMEYYGDDITLEIDKANIVEKDEDSNYVYITIRGDSDLAKQLYRMKYTNSIEI
jgi:hypothetical protein